MSDQFGTAIYIAVLCDFISVSAHEYYRVCVAVLQFSFVTVGMLMQVGRYYYDPVGRIAIQKHKLELWPGYVTSIRQHEDELLLCVELTHKVMRQDTVHDLLQECYKSSPTNYQVIRRSLTSHTYIHT